MKKHGKRACPKCGKVTGWKNDRAHSSATYFRQTCKACGFTETRARKSLGERLRVFLAGIAARFGRRTPGQR